MPHFDRINFSFFALDSVAFTTQNCLARQPFDGTKAYPGKHTNLCIPTFLDLQLQVALIETTVFTILPLHCHERVVGLIIPLCKIIKSKVRTYCANNLTIVIKVNKRIYFYFLAYPVLRCVTLTFSVRKTATAFWHLFSVNMQLQFSAPLSELSGAYGRSIS